MKNKNEDEIFDGFGKKYLNRADSGIDNPLLEQVWVTRTGERVKVKDMTGEHAKNSLAFVLDKIAKGHLVWTDARTGQFKYDPLTTRPKPINIVDRMALDIEAMLQPLSQIKHATGD